jgi:death on curing protein
MTRYLTLDEAVIINKRLILKYNDKEQIGVKDLGLLESALNRPKQTVFGEDAYPTIFHKATALLESVAKNHSFFNGNKRTGFASMVIFLHMNGYNFVMDNKEAEDFTVDVVNKKYSFEEMLEIIRNHSRKM